MQIPVVDLFVSLFFLGTLAVSAGFLRHASADSKASLRSILIGLALLSAVSLLDLAKSVGLLNDLRIVGEPLVYQLVLWLGMIAGIVCIALGVSRRISRSDEKDASQDIHQRRWNLLRQIEQLSLVEHRTPVLLNKTLQFLVEGFECKHGALYLRSRKKSGMLFMRSEGAAAYAERAYHRIEFDVRPDEISVLGIESTESERTEVPSGMTTPDTVVPVVTERGVVAAFLLWKKEEAEWQAEDVQTMKLAASIIARIVEVERLTLKHEFLLTRESWQEEAARLLSTDLPLNDQLPALFKHICSEIPADLVSIGIVSSQNMLRRVSTSEVGGLLDEHRLNLHRERSHITEVLKGGKPLLVANAHTDPHLPTDDFLIRNGAESVVSVPLIGDSGYRSVITLAHSAEATFTPRHLSLLDSLTPLLREIIAKELRREKERSYHSRILLVSELLQHVAANKPIDEVITQVGATLARVAEASIVRISMLDLDAVTLHSRFLTCSHATHVSTPADGMMVLSLMPQHSQLISGEVTEPIYCANEQGEISEAEAMLAFAPSIKQMLLVPIRANGRVVGIVSCADMRGKARTEYTPTDIALIQTLAGIIGTVAHRRMASDVLYGSLPDPLKAGERTLGIRPAVRSSLSGIVGSLEMLQTAPGAQDQDVRRYLSIIDRSAQRLSRVLDEEHVVVNR